MKRYTLIIIAISIIWILALLTVGPATGQGTSTPTPASTEIVNPTSLITPPAPDRVKVAESEHFIFYMQDDYMPVDLDEFMRWAEESYTVVAEQIGAEIEQKMRITFMAPLPVQCPPRGAMSVIDGQPELWVYADEHTSDEQLRGVIAHEIAHAVHSFGLPGGLSVELALNEGLATWASRDYWVEWLAIESLDDLVRSYIDEDTYLPLDTHIDVYNLPRTDSCLDLRNQLYSEWASLTGYLLAEYGMADFIDLMESARSDRRGEVVRPDFEGVYGLTLTQLEAAWLDWLLGVESVSSPQIPTLIW